MKNYSLFQNFVKHERNKIEYLYMKLKTKRYFLGALALCMLTISPIANAAFTAGVISTVYVLDNGERVYFRINADGCNTYNKYYYFDQAPLIASAENPYSSDKEWLAMLLSASFADKEVTVYFDGGCDFLSHQKITALRLNF